MDGSAKLNAAAFLKEEAARAAILVEVAQQLQAVGTIEVAATDAQRRLEAANEHLDIVSKQVFAMQQALVEKRQEFDKYKASVEKDLEGKRKTVDSYVVSQTKAIEDKMSSANKETEDILNAAREQGEQHKNDVHAELSDTRQQIKAAQTELAQVQSEITAARDRADKDFQILTAHVAELSRTRDNIATSMANHQGIIRR